jgi:NAD(P)-dependent dehydrogenase (short-subunit alcohol dehydrogenase family)
MSAYVAAKAGVAALTSRSPPAPRRRHPRQRRPASIIDAPRTATRCQADHAKWPKPAEIAEAIAFLASPENTLTSGALVPVYGRS